MDYRMWSRGKRIVDRHGFEATFIAAWNGFVWLIYDNHPSPSTVEAWTVAELPTKLA